jgi:hypothetical protein
MKYGFENNQFYVEFPKLSRQPGNMKEESDRRAVEMASVSKNLILSMSSGVDSQSVLHSFYTQGIPINCVFFYMPGYNEVEYNQLKEVQKKYKIKIDILDLDPIPFEEEIMVTAKQEKIHPIQLMQAKFTGMLPTDADIIQMIHDPFVHITADNFYFYQGYHSPELARIRAMGRLKRTGKYIPYGDTSEFLYSILNDDVYKAAIYTHRYFDGNGLDKPGCYLKSVDRWDYYIKPIIYGKYWKDELIYFPKYAGYEGVPFLRGEPSNPEWILPSSWYRDRAVLIPYFEFLKNLETEDKKYFQRPDKN